MVGVEPGEDVGLVEPGSEHDCPIGPDTVADDVDGFGDLVHQVVDATGDSFRFGWIARGTERVGLLKDRYSDDSLFRALVIHESQDSWF